MMHAMRRIGLAVAVISGCFAAGTSAGTLDTVNWAADGTVDGTGTGTLGGTNTVTYSTATGFNAGTTIFEDWASYAGTGPATGGSVTNQSGGVLGGGAGGTLQTITFSSLIANPILLVNYLNTGDVLDFGSNVFTVISSNNATAVGNVVSASGATDSPNDGFALRFNGSFAPGTPLQLTYTTDGQGGDSLETVGFTIGASPAVVPEPSTLATAGFAGLIGLGYMWRRRRRISRSVA